MTISRNALLVALLALLFGGSERAYAHQSSEAYLALTLSGTAVSGRMDLHLQDLDHAFGLDTDRDGQITWAEALAAKPALDAALADSLVLSGPKGGCPHSLGALELTRRSDGVYAVLPLSAACPGALDGIALHYDLLFPFDAGHRLRVTASDPDNADTWIGTLTPSAPATRLGPAEPLPVFIPFLWQGVVHMLEGIDHVLFLLTLLLTACLVRGPSGWQMALSFYTVAARTAGLVTAFTIGHSITLALAASGTVLLPPGPVEALIAATVAFAALNIVWPMVTRRVWVVAAGFGLIHGFGFANVLAELDLPPADFALALFAFNLGVEVGQLLCVALVLPLTYLAGRLALYRQVALPALSLGVAGVGAIWLVERSFGVIVLGI